jgi:myo-inositol-1(or 4)-monophosphatase
MTTIEQMTEIMETARAAARAGGEVLRRYFAAELVIQHKAGEGTHNLVSAADLEAEQVIASVVREAFSKHAILGEELHQADVGAADLWIVDPLDGTNNFLHGIPHFAVSIAYYHEGQPQLGIIYNPIREDWYEAQRGAGAWHNGKRVQVAGHERLDQTIVGIGFYYDRGAMMEATLMAIRDLFRQQIHGVRRFGTAALDLAHVGCGWYGAYFEFQLAPWDFAAGRLFVEEAGGRVTACDGSPLPLAKTSLLASNTILHEATLSVIEPHLMR